MQTIIIDDAHHEPLRFIGKTTDDDFMRELTRLVGKQFRLGYSGQRNEAGEWEYKVTLTPEPVTATIYDPAELADRSSPPTP